jgi:tRNA dimethylallyltransferase
MAKPKLLVILGPTASGKSKLAVELAQKYNGEIISADSVQVYKGLNIGSAKVEGVRVNGTFTYKNIPHHCIDFIDPDEKFTVAQYKECAEKAIDNIVNRGKLPILVGGTGFYIQAVVDGIMLPEVKPNEALRKELSTKTLVEIFEILQKLDPKRAANIDTKNARRLIRAIEIVKQTKSPVPQLNTELKYDAQLIGIKMDDVTLKKRIEQRAHEQIGAGLLEEIRQLRDAGISNERMQEFGFEYKYGLQALESTISIEKLEQILIKENWRYAKRQLTWFKRDKRIHWIQSLAEIEQNAYFKALVNTSLAT